MKPYGLKLREREGKGRERGAARREIEVCALDLALEQGEANRRHSFGECKVIDGVSHAPRIKRR